MTYTIGTFNLVPFLAKDGVKITRSDLDGPNAGRLLNGDMIRDRVATKYRWDFTCIPLTDGQLAQLLKSIQPESFIMSVADPTTGMKLTNFKCYSNNFSYSAYGEVPDPGTGGATTVGLWTGFSFPAIQL